MKKPDQIISCFNEGERAIADPGSESRIANTIYMANESRLTESNYSEEVTDYVVGLAEREQLEADLNAIAPAVPVARRFEYKKADDDADFLSESDDVRAIGADFKRVTSPGSTVTAKTLNKGLTQRLDRDNLPVGGNPIGRAAAVLTNRLFRNDLRRAVALYAAAPNTAKTWGATQNPDKDLLDMVEAAADDAGIYPNVIIMSMAAWNLRYSSLTTGSRTNASASTGWSMQQLAEFLGVDRIIPIRERYTLKKGQAKSQVWGSNVVCANLQSLADTDDASNVKRFVTTTEAGSGIRVHVDESQLKFIDVTVEHYSLLSSPSSKGMIKYTVS